MSHDGETEGWPDYEPAEPKRARDLPRQLAKIPPHNFEAEMALLGAILTNTKAYDVVASILTPEDFADKRHGEIFAAISYMRLRGMAADAVVLRSHFDTLGILEELGGGSYLARLASSVVTVVNVEDYAWTIKDRKLRRDLIDQCERAIQDAYDIRFDKGATDIVGEAVGGLSRALGLIGNQHRMTIGEAAAKALASMNAAAQRGDGIVGVPLYLTDVDNILKGLRPGRLIYLAARPGMGKSTLAVNTAVKAAMNGAPVCFFQLEMEDDEMGAMALAVISGIPADRILSAQLTNEEIEKVVEAKTILDDIPLTIDCRPKQTVAEMFATARLIKPKLTVIDHMLLAGGEAPGIKYRSKVELTGAVSASMKEMAKHLRCPILALTQLTRPEKGKEDRRPTLEDLRWSGELEQDADTVLMLYRPHYYLQRTPVDERDEEWNALYGVTMNVTEVHIQKHRGGPGANRHIDVFYDPTKGVFGDKARSAEQQAAEQGQLPVW